MAIDVFDQNDRGVDDDAEIDGANGQQVGGFATNVKDAKGKQQGERNIESHNQSHAHVVEKHEQNHGNERQADQQVLVHRFGGEIDEIGAIVIGLDLHAGQQVAGLIQLTNFG